MHPQLEELENLMLVSDDDVRVVGICGMGGIGKTTLATALYARISNQFEAGCYIDVSETYGGYGPIGVQKQLLCQTLKEENLQICNLYMVSNLIRTRLCQIKSLVILDNVDQVEQLDKLATIREWLGTGSRIIVISRDCHILREHGADEVYQVQLLDHSNSLQLFCWKAFKSDDIVTGYTDLTNGVLIYANGLPLAIKVLGSFLYGRDVFQWRSALERLKENPRADIMDVLRISFDGLEDTEKDIFLDIACFLHGESETYVKKVLDFRGFDPEIGLRVLNDKSLITFEMGRIFMHDLFQELGKNIVREKSAKQPRKWNRMWDCKDVHNVISENMETKNIEAIVLQRYPDNIEEIRAMSTLRAESLAQMDRLKLLMLWNLNFSGSLNFLSSELGYLCWDKYPFTCLPSSFEPDKLVELILPRSNIRQLWVGTKPLHNLTCLDLSHSENLILMPSFLEIPNLEYLDLEGCIKLVQIDPSICILRRLSKLNLKNCTNLVSIPKIQIPMWFNKQNVGSSISMEPLPNMDDKNLIGVAFCIAFVAHDNPTSFCYGISPCISFRINGKRGSWRVSHIPIHHGKDLVTVDLHHLCLVFSTREKFIDGMNFISEGLHDNIELEVSVGHPLGLHLEVKNCGYRWIFKEDLEQLNPQMYLTDDWLMKNPENQ